MLLGNPTGPETIKDKYKKPHTTTMRRLGRSLVSYGTRFNSTVAGTSTATPESTLPRSKRNGITLRWGTVVIRMSNRPSLATCAHM